MMDDSYPFTVDERTRRMLGVKGLAALARNLWPEDCQTCGQSFGGTRPALQVAQVGDDFAAASLHHLDCQAAGWVDNGIVQTTSAALLTFSACALLVPGHTSDNRDHPWPFMFVNPSLEQVFLEQDPHNEWVVATVAHYTRVGFAVPGPQLGMNDNPVAGATAVLDPANQITVEVGVDCWSADCNPPVLANRIRYVGGIMVVIGTAYLPAHIAEAQGFARALRSGQVAVGFVPLT